MVAWQGTAWHVRQTLEANMEPRSSASLRVAGTLLPHNCSEPPFTPCKPLVAGIQLDQDAKYPPNYRAALQLDFQIWTHVCDDIHINQVGEPNGNADVEQVLIF